MPDFMGLLPEGDEVTEKVTEEEQKARARMRQLADDLPYSEIKKIIAKHEKRQGEAK